MELTGARSGKQKTTLGRNSPLCRAARRHERRGRIGALVGRDAAYSMLFLTFSFMLFLTFSASASEAAP